MTLIKRDELPVALRAAYDEAAKGTKDDITRKDGKNDDTQVDSPLEVISLFTKVEKLYESKQLSKTDFQNFYKRYSNVYQNSSKIYIDCHFDLVNKKFEDLKQKQDEEMQSQKQEQIEAARRTQLKEFKQKHPKLAKIDDAISDFFGAKNVLFDAFYFEEPMQYQFVLSGFSK